MGGACRQQLREAPLTREIVGVSLALLDADPATVLSCDREGFELT